MILVVISSPQHHVDHTRMTLIVVNGIHYMNNLGLFLFKTLISFGVWRSI